MYKKIYPSGSNAGKFYGTAKIHKLKPGEGVNKLPLRPIISNIGTASYHLAKHLSKLLSPLSQSEHTVSSTKEFLQNLKTIGKVPANFEIVSFDVKSLFTSVPLEATINVILRRI